LIQLLHRSISRHLTISLTTSNISVSDGNSATSLMTSTTEFPIENHQILQLKELLSKNNSDAVEAQIQSFVKVCSLIALYSSPLILFVLLIHDR
jgi:hypothetical protein